MATTNTPPQSSPKKGAKPAPDKGSTSGAKTGTETPGAGASATPDSSALNQQIVQAVEVTKSSVLDVAQQEGQSVAYQKVTQATAFAIQDATDYLRNVETISTAAQGVALTKLIEEKDPFYLTVLTAAQAAVVAAQTNFTAVGTAATTVTTSYPAGN